jgi:hypothetical protein
MRGPGSQEPHGNPDRWLAKTTVGGILTRRGKALATLDFDYTVPFLFPGLIAQSVEQRPFKALVLGSSPSQPRPSRTAFLLGNQPGTNPRSASRCYAPNTLKYAKSALYLSSFYQVSFSSVSCRQGGSDSPGGRQVRPVQVSEIFFTGSARWEFARGRRPITKYRSQI